MIPLFHVRPINFEYPRRTSFSDPKGSFGKIIKLLANNQFLFIAHLELSLGNKFDIQMCSEKK